MYNDGVITNEFTGYYDAEEGEFVSPSAHQNLIIKFPTFYLSADDGDITDSGVTITSETGESEDITIGNAPAKVLTATMLNPVGLMEGLTWGDGTVYIGVATAADACESTAEVYAKKGTAEYAITDTQIVPPTGTAIGYQGDPAAIVVSDDGTAWFYTDSTAYYYDGTAVAEATQSDAFLLHKYQNASQRGILLDANGLPSTTWANGESNTYTYVPMGVYDFSNVDAFGITFGVEAYDRMTLFDADATDWAASLDFTTSKTLSTILSELMTEMGFSGNYTVSASAVNTTLTYSENPITAYAVTYRQILRWIAEAMGCSARMSRTGGVELWAWDSTSRETITPYTIIGNTRTKARYTVPQITEVVCYDTLGMNYASGSEGVPYYIAANPFLTGLDTSVAPLTNICTLLRGIPVYYPSVIGQMYADPRLDTGDFVTLQTTDGTSPYVVPVMRQTLHWGGVCEATLVASGNQQRAVPSDLIDNNLSTTVNGRKILEGVDAKRITVLDEDENVLFNADTETDEVNIAGFTVTDNGLDYTLTEPSGDGVLAGHTNTALIHVGTDGVERSVDAWEVFEDDSDDPPVEVAGEVLYSEVLGGDSTANTGFHAHYEVVDTGALGYPTYTADSYLRAESLQFNYDMPGEVTTTNLVNADGMVTQMNNAIGRYGTRIYLSDGTYTKTISASGPTSEIGSGTTSIASGSYKTLGSVDFPRGMYLIIVNARFPNNATGCREVLLSPSQNSSSAPTEFYLDSRNAVNGNYTNCKFTAVRNFSAASTTMYINAYQNSGGNQSVFYRWLYVRLA